MIKKFIENIIKEKGIENYSLNHGSFTSDEWANGLNLGKDICIVYQADVLISADNLADFMTKGLFQLKSVNETVNYTHKMRLSEMAGLIQLSSDYVSVHHTKLEYSALNPGIATGIYSGHFNYWLIKKIDHIC